MSRFYRQFLTGKARGKAPPVAFCFGKHPGWNDHIDPIGIADDSLALCQSLFYVQGIGGAIDAGLWDKAPPDRTLAVFDNLALWQAGSSFLLLRLWSSVDGKGRSKYPMIIGLEVTGLPVATALPALLPLLAETEKTCRETRSADAVRAALDRLQQAAAAALAPLSGGSPVDGLTPADAAALAALPAFARQPEAWPRLFHALQSSFASFAPGVFSPREFPEGGGGRHLRLPLPGDGPVPTLTRWLAFFRHQLDPAVPLLLTLSPHRPWCDLIAGEPSARDLGGLRFNLDEIPCATDIPYTLDPAFRQRAASALESLLRDGANPRSLLFAAAPPGRSGGGFFRSLFGAGKSG